MSTDSAHYRRTPSADTVVLVHGLAANRLMMKPLEVHLKDCGFRTINWGYRSVWDGIESHARRLLLQLDALERSPAVEHIRLVTHSMGGIVARKVLAEVQLEKLRSIVMLGPPNHGSRVAAVLAKALGWICRPLSQLSDSEDSFVNKLAVPDGIDIGIIAAMFDRVVAVESTHIATELEHCVVPTGHNSMLFSRDVATLVGTFLREGVFATSQDSLASPA